MNKAYNRKYTGITEDPISIHKGEETKGQERNPMDDRV